MEFLGIDIGGSFIKSAILDTERFEVREVKKVNSPELIANTNPLIRENDPREILNTVRQTIDTYIKAHPDRIYGILLSTQMHGFMLIDENGHPVTNYITWQDERSTEKMENSEETYLERIRKVLEPENIRKSGSPVKPSLGMCNLYHWLYYNKSDKPLWFCTLGDYIISKLSGEKPVCHITNAASTGMIDLESKEWNRNIIDVLGFNNIVFPEIVHENEICGIYRPDSPTLSLQHRGSMYSEGIPLYPAVGDHQAAMFGAFLKPGIDLAINIGTGSQICIMSEELVFGEYETRPFFGGKYLKAICHIPAGRALNVLVNFVSDVGLKVYDTQKDEDEIWACIDRYIRQADDPDLEVNISFFRASAVPYEGVIRNINEHNLTLENLFYGAFKNMVLNYNKLYKKIMNNGDEVQRVVCAGGLARKSPVLMDLIESTFQLHCSLTPYSEDTLVGLLRIAQGCIKL